MTHTIPTAVGALGVLALTLTGCAPLDADTRISVTQTETRCELSATEIPAGITTFVIENVGDGVAEFYILRTTDSGIVTEVENISSGLTRELTVELAAGEYEYSCEQMDGGTPVRGPLTVTPNSEVVTPNPTAERAIADYTEYVRGQAKSLLDATHDFAAAIEAGDTEAAKALYAPTRVFWERIEPVAESFGDLDPRMDAREGDLEDGVPWTGWHALEKQLWVTGLDETSTGLAQQLVTDTEDLVARIDSIELTITQMGNGAKELLDEVATGKVTGEEERYSHTDLWDFDANVFGAYTVVETTREILAEANPALLTELDDAFAALNAEMDTHRIGDGFALYTELSPEQISRLAALVEAVSEPLSRLSASLVQD
ncbi:MAG: lipoprotein [Actinomycetota bacterium]|jgi:iron uptake system component EfeO